MDLKQKSPFTNLNGLLFFSKMVHYFFLPPFLASSALAIESAFLAEAAAKAKADSIAKAESAFSC